MSDVKKRTYGPHRDQGGFVRRDQLRASKSTIQSWIRTGRLIPVFHNVYAVGYVPKEPERRA